MDFYNAVRDAGFAGLMIYVVSFVLAHLLNWRRFEPLRMLGIVLGVVAAAGLVEQYAVQGVWRALVFGASVGVATWLFQALGRRFPFPRPR